MTSNPGGSSKKRTRSQGNYSVVSTAEQYCEALKQTGGNSTSIMVAQEGGRTSRAKTEEIREKGWELYEEWLDEQAEILRQRREEAFNNLPPAPDGTRGDGNFYISFIQVGQGDCCLITTPAGRIIMVDCGSVTTEGGQDDDDVMEDDDENTDPYLNRLRGVVNLPYFLKDRYEIDILILTHPDGDHYNKLKKVFTNALKIGVIYHSKTIAHYATGGTSGWLSGRVEDISEIKEVVVNRVGAKGGITLAGVAVAPADDTHKIERLDGAGGIRIVEEANCKISIIAAGVHAGILPDNMEINDHSDNDDKNRGSVVTLIEVFGKKILLSGDATTMTEYVILSNPQLKPRIQNVHLMHVAHHGSDTTSGSSNWVKWVNPEKAVVSVALRDDKFHLPQWRTIAAYRNRFVDSARPEVPEHEIFYWKRGTQLEGLTYTSQFVKFPLYTTGSNGTNSTKLIDEMNT